MMLDKKMMERALNLANQAKLISPPNPWVGCVIVKDSKIVGEGHTQPPGGDHAEIVALKQAKGLAKGATAYITLEPCSHYGRTPPCVNQMLEAGISQFVIGIEDPDNRVNGQGIAVIRQAGREISLGLYANEISESLRPYLYHRRTGLPYCILKAALSIDGKIAASDGTSQWISSEEARLDTHYLRAQSQAILIGSGTACHDDPSLTVRHPNHSPINPPLRVILDATGKMNKNNYLFNTQLAPTLIFTSSNCAQKTLTLWKNHGIQVEIVPLSKKGVGVDLDHVMLALGKRNILQVMVEGGRQIFDAFLEAKKIHRLIVYIGSMILGNKGIPFFEAKSIDTLKDAQKLTLIQTTMLGNSVKLDYLFNIESNENIS